MIKNIMKNIGTKSGLTEEARKKLLELEKARKSKTDSLDDNSVRLEQAKLLEAAGFNTRKDFDEYLKKEAGEKVTTDITQEDAAVPRSKDKDYGLPEGKTIKETKFTVPQFKDILDNKRQGTWDRYKKDIKSFFATLNGYKYIVDDELGKVYLVE